MKKKIVSLILIILILQYFCIFVFANDSITNEITNSTTNSIADELEKQKEDVENKLEEANTELEYVQDELSDTMLKVQETEDKILKYQKEVDELGEKMETLQKSIDESTAKLEIASQNYEEKSDLLAKRLVAMYEAGETQYLDVFLQSRNNKPNRKKSSRWYKGTDSNRQSVFLLLLGIMAKDRGAYAPLSFWENEWEVFTK